MTTITGDTMPLTKSKNRVQVPAGYLSISEVAALTDLHRRTIRRYQVQKIIPTRYKWMGGTRVLAFTQADVEKILAAKKAKVVDQRGFREFLAENKRLKKKQAKKNEERRRLAEEKRP